MIILAVKVKLILRRESLFLCYETICINIDKIVVKGYEMNKLNFIVKHKGDYYTLNIGIRFFSTNLLCSCTYQTHGVLSMFSQTGGRNS